MTETRTTPEESANAFPFAKARNALLAWFERAGRKFPWRENPTPYRVWVSEIMLQQTTTATVEPYYERFLERFPDPASLAAAPESEVLRYWEGLGYYRRARSMKAAAEIMVDRFQGRVPDSSEALESLPGIGRYAAGAILSFGFDQPAPILEANTTRLHARLLALRTETTKAPAQKILWNFAEKWTRAREKKNAPGLYRRINAALTDLGRLVCAPGEPKCDECPLTFCCRANAENAQTEIPVLPPRNAAIPRVDVALWIARRDLFPRAKKGQTDVMLVKRPKGALWEGLWDFPKFEDLTAGGTRNTDWRTDPWLAAAVARFLTTETGAPPADYRVGAVAATIRHSVTKYRVVLHLCRLSCAIDAQPSSLFDALAPDPAASIPAENTTEREPPSRIAEEWRWVPIEELQACPLSSPGRRAADVVVGATREKDRAKD